MNVLRNTLFFLIATVASAALMLSIPVLSLLLGAGLKLTKPKELRKTEVTRVQMAPEQQQKKNEQRPRRSASRSQQAKAGPRFAMALGAESWGAGVAVPQSLTNAPGSGSSGNDRNDVDTRPELSGTIDLVLPERVRKSEQNAKLQLMFCVDITGKTYDIKVTREDPPGLGLAAAGIEAVQRLRFRPAIKDGQPVPFCGMEQPFEIKFRN